jgi:excisionase family DNA binding protein
MHKDKISAFITADEGHAWIGKDKLSRRSFYNALERNQIPNVRFGRRILIPRHAFFDWLQKRGALASEPVPKH